MTRPPRGRQNPAGSAAGGRRWMRHTITEAEEGRSLQEVLLKSIGVSGRMVQKLTRASGIRLNGRPAFLKRKVRAGDVVSVRLSFDEDPGLEPVAMPLSIAYEDDDLIVVDKPAGLLVHPLGARDRTTLAHGITHHLLQAGIRTRVRPVHRLDRDTSGLLIVAKSAFAHQALDRQLRGRELHRGYLALVEGVPHPAVQTIDAPIARHPRHPHLRTIMVGGADALTRFAIREDYAVAALLDVELETGRTHQIRVHLAHLGHPLMGDVQYGGSAGEVARQALHAARISFRNPRTGVEISLTSALPDDLDVVRQRLEGRRRPQAGPG